MHGHVLAAVLISANAAGNGILIVFALALAAIAGIIAILIKPVNWWAVLVAAAFAVYMAALLVGN
jgi:hypothetical protein